MEKDPEDISTVRSAGGGLSGITIYSGFGT